MRRLRLLYPFWFAALPALNLAVHNPGWVKADDLLVVLAVTLAAFAAVYTLLVLLTRALRLPIELAALAVLALVAGFYLYRTAYGMASRAVGGRATHLVVVAGFAGLAVALTVLTRRSGLLDRLTTFFMLSGTMLVLWLGGQAVLTYLRGYMAVRHSGLVAELTAPIPQLAGSGAREPRVTQHDIYLIILDEHANSTVLREQLGLDNRSFEDSLRGLGFTIPHLVRSNYLNTLLSLPSLLNFAHLTRLQAELGRSMDPAVPDHLVQVNRAARFLKAHGYRVVFFPSQWWPATQHLEVADEEVNVWPGLSLSHALARSDFRRKLRDRTPLSFTALGGPAEYADHLRRTFAALARMPTEPGPKFVLAHVLSPHWPQILDRHCDIRRPRPGTGNRVEGAGNSRAYAEQLQCLDRMVLGLAQVLLERSSVPPIILLQGDHGTTFTEERSPEHARERSGAFGAYYLPDGGDRVFGDSVTIVNVLPKVFNHYFAAGLPLLSDALYLSFEKTPYVLEQVDPAGLARRDQVPASLRRRAPTLHGPAPPADR